MNPSLFVIIPGFGLPQIELKFDILRNNLKRIKAYPWKQLRIHICIYDDTDIPYDILKENPEIDISRHPGIVGDFLIQHANPEAIHDFSHILILLDDIALVPNVNFRRMLYLQEFFRLDILSPSLTLDSHSVYQYMLTSDDHFEFKISPTCEMFCYFMPYESYKKYYPHIDPQNPWMWGLDLVLERQIGMKVAIMNVMNMKHFLKSTCYSLHPDKDPVQGMEYVLKKYNETREGLADQPSAHFRVSPTYLHESMQP